MTRTTARWTTALAAAALFALPASGLAQDPPAQPPAQPPATAQPTTPSEPAQQPAQPSASQEAVKQHLTAARDALAQVTKLPAAATLSGDARMQVTQLINNFNELITTKGDWQSAHAKVEANLNALLGPEPPDPARPSGTPGAVGTSGAGGLDPSIRAKLVEFRGHLEQFEKAVNPPQQAPATPATPPAAATATPPAAATTTTTTTSTTTTAPAAPPAPDAPEEMVPVNPKEVRDHIEAIETILNAQAAAQAALRSAAGGTVGTAGTASGSTKTTITSAEVMLTQAQVEQLKTHLSELKRLIEKK